MNTSWPCLLRSGVLPFMAILAMLTHASAGPPPAPAHVLVFDNDPFLTRSAQVLAEYSLPDWTSAPLPVPGPIQLTVERLGGTAGSGLGSPSRQDLGAAPAMSRFVLVNQVAPDIAFFDLGGARVPPGLDADGNGLEDAWERRFFGRVGVDPNGDDDGDGFTNLAEFRAGTTPTDAAARPAIPGLLVRWRGEDSTADDTGTQVGTWQGNIAYGDGFVGRAFAFDGRSVIRFGAEAGLRPATNVTLAAWVKLDRPPGNLAPLLAHPSLSGALPALALAVGNQGPRMLVSSASGTQTEGPVMAVETGRWMHLAATWDGRLLRMFVNGQATFEARSNPVVLDYAPHEGWRLGALDGLGVLEGQVDEVVIAEGALDAATIQALAGGYTGVIPEASGGLRVEIELARDGGVGDGGEIRLILPEEAPDVVVEALPGFGERWSPVTPTVRVENGKRILTLPWSPTERSRFFRLRH